ncbi:bacteriophage abortive infection AbiH family protein [Neobacillus soli]|uniref:bacteriophage abortive infection AbiH family protein n=1 Tax=Neobacillus soli TaxID=220688 RepID=UPI000825CF9F|nr:bacteriophage abortive infection AbiH family protein [Neobacillus soli]
MLFYLINQAENDEAEWKDIEASLGRLDFSEVYDWLDDIVDKDGDINPWKTASRNEDIAEDLIVPTAAIQRYFSEWVDSINISSAEPKQDFKSLIGDGEQFLTFNYTDTLEEVYGIDESNICHIHGRQGAEIYFGHGETEDYSEIYMQQHIGSENGLSRIDRQLRKETEKALETNCDFFYNLEELNINKIYSYGFSFSMVDKIYLGEICSLINTEEVIWYFNDYDLSSVEKYKELLNSCGFKGSFDTFHIGK